MQWRPRKAPGVPVAIHTSTPEGMRRAILGGAETIEHGDGGTPEIFKIMAEHQVALCPTLAAGNHPLPYPGPVKSPQGDSKAVQRKKARV